MVKKEEPEKIPQLNRTMAELNKKFGAGTIGYLGKMKNLEIERVPTGIQQFDEIIGGGLPLGRMVEFYGIQSSGKTLISLKAVASAQKQGLECVYVDAENAFDPEFAKLLGVDVDKLAITQVSEGEDLFDMLAEILKSQPGVIVVDSVAAIITTKEIEESMEQQFMAPKARLMSRGLPKLLALNKKTLIIFINQLRETMVLYGKKTTTTGGRALGYYASIRVEVKQGEKLTADGKKTSEAIGQEVQFRVDKTKVGVPFKSGSFEFYYNGEIK